MARIEERLKSPDLPSLRKIKAKLDQAINDGSDPEFSEPELVDLYDCIEWVDSFLSKRRDYHKGHQVKQKTELALLREALSSKGVDVEALRKRVRDGVADALIDESSEEPVFPRSQRSVRDENEV